METPALRIRLLGELDLRLGSDPLPPLESGRAESLLAYLLLHRDAPQPRQQLAFLLWPDSTESQARTNLRHVLHNLRRALPDLGCFLVVSSRTLQWRADAPFWLDVAAFEGLLQQAERAEPAVSVCALREAVALYAGDLLPGCYDEWLLAERERLHQRYLRALERLTALLSSQGEYAAAIAYAERLLRHDPLHEESYRLLMRLHQARGDGARALRVYHDCAAVLERELGVEPSAATREAYHTLLPATREPDNAAQQPGRLSGAPLVGRLPDWAHLTTLWRTTASGRAHLVLVGGEPGVGKTRLVEEFRSWCVHRGAATAEARAYPAEGSLAYGLLVAWLHSEALQRHLARLDRARLLEIARLLPELRAEAPDLASRPPLSEDEQRLLLFDAATQVVLAAESPLLLVAEDLHWADQQSLQFLHYLLRAAPDARLLVVATARREELDRQHPLHTLLAGLRLLDRVTEIQLGPLSREESALLAERASGRSFARPDADHLFAETEGNALFIIEALRAGWTGERSESAGMTPKVQAVIESRLAQLSEPAQNLVGIAATIGREFTPEVLTTASEAGDEALVPALDELWRRRIIREQGAQAYDFSHDKIREVAYLGLSPATRRRHHRSVARALERLHTADPDEAALQIASHWERTGDFDRAITWYQRTAEAAQKLHASGDAARLLDYALNLLRALPETCERSARELTILAALPAPLGAVEGYASPRLDGVHQRALALTATLGVAPPSPLLRSLAIASLTRSDFAAAQRVGSQLHERAGRDADEVLLVESEYVLGIAAFWQGQLHAARKHFDIAVERYRPQYSRAHLLQYGLDPKVICLSRLANTLWFLGHAGAATRTRDAALVLAEEIGHPISRATALIFASVLAVDMREPERVGAYATTLAALHNTLEARQTRVAAEAIDGYLDVVEGRITGLARLKRALDTTRDLEHAPGMRATIERLLLEACAQAGATGAGLDAANDALTTSVTPLWEAETRRLRAEFLAAENASWPEVEAELGRALQVAHRQGALALQLRTAVSLFRIRRRRSDEPALHEAENGLRVILAAMPAEEETAETREARSLLV
jgi:DNA-binding SARP family transcriptional activator/tetratricopeptide (TPR) repeat protein